jgi:hypothetical protein
LDPLNLPTAEQLTCGVTGQTLQFLLQVYCPADDNPTDAFHRAIFLFVSPRVSLSLLYWIMQQQQQQQQQPMEDFVTYLSCLAAAQLDHFSC